MGVTELGDLQGLLRTLSPTCRGVHTYRQRTLGIPSHPLLTLFIDLFGVFLHLSSFFLDLIDPLIDEFETLFHFDLHLILFGQLLLPTSCLILLLLLAFDGFEILTPLVLQPLHFFTQRLILHFLLFCNDSSIFLEILIL